ncbi:uncharacterized protein LOC126687752 [Mercurialis annua]|uniref:uncharacterized protein LOC126687752 n=1 Tax=Mercurialis annua TaxID=3986 RepID=UPI00215EA43D|nr:uncharacterized protein LOC126687752 [Mercurialis annua]
MASAGSSSPGVPVFTGVNYQIWVVKMKSYLKSLGLWNSVIIGGDPPPLRANPTVAQIKKYEEELLKKDKALTCLHAALADNVFTSIMALESAKEVWKKLKEENEGSERVKTVRLLSLKREFENLKLKESEAVKEYSSKVMELVNQMSLPEKFEAKVSAIEESCDLKKLAVAELISKLQVQEQRASMRLENGKKGSGDRKESSKFGKGKFPPCIHCKKTNHHESKCWKKAQCKICNRIGHIDRFCRQRTNQPAQNQLIQQQQANFIEDQTQQEGHLFMVSRSLRSTNKNMWYIDSGCTSHMTNDESLFSSIDKAFKTEVKLGNGMIVKARGKGLIPIRTKQGTKLISDVLLIPSLSQNLLSVAQIQNKGYSVVLKNNYCFIFDPSDVEIAKVKKIDNSYVLNLNYVDQHVYSAKKDDTLVWHRRFGHYNVKPLKLCKRMTW